MKYIAFISHSNKDAKALHAVREYLESCGYACFASERDLMHNAGWQSQLVEAMDSSDMLVYLHSKNANDSAEVGREINYFADKCHRPILVYRLDDVAYNRDRAYYLQSINYIDSLISPEAGLDQLAANVRHTLEGMPAEGLADNPGKARILLRRAAIPLLAVFLLLCAFLGFHAFEKGKAARLQEQGAGLLSRVDGWLAQEDSLELILPAVQQAEDLYTRSSGMLTVKAQDTPDFAMVRDWVSESLSEIRERRISTVKALYEPLKYASKENAAASSDIILSNIGKIHQIDDLLGLPTDEVIESIENQIK
jgi:hypothetical protein